MFHNMTVKILRSNKTVDDSGGVREEPTALATGIRMAMQGHTIQSLPPPPQTHHTSGLEYIREYRVWVGKQQSFDAEALRVNDYIEVTAVHGRAAPAKVGAKYRIIAAIDDAGVGHHWLLRVVDYD